VTSAADRRRAAIEGTNAATKQVIRLGIEPDSPVDIFGVIESSRIWLLFEKLENLFGFFQREDDIAGIALHSGHPLSLQRFTAAHEYGHYVLGHAFSQDGGAEVYGAGDLPVQEVQAQAFAAEFLMPLALINRALERLSLPETPKEIGPADAYQLSLEIGASYRATVARLNELNKIPFERAEALREFAPKALKVELGSGHGPVNPRAAVWSVDEELRGRQLNMRIEDELHLRLGEIPSSGYRWVLAEGSGEGLELLADELEREGAGGERLGGPATRHLWWRAVEPVTGVFELSLTREWQGAEAQPVDTLTLPISIQIAHNATEAGTGLALPQRQAILAGA
jgi:Zn-dependent peptidase ImmA (M78 family)/predicted secreted protein